MKLVTTVLVVVASVVTMMVVAMMVVAMAVVAMMVVAMMVVAMMDSWKTKKISSCLVLQLIRLCWVLINRLHFWIQLLIFDLMK